MAQSKREQIVRAVVALIEGVANVPVLRSPYAPVSSAVQQAVIVDWQREGIDVANSMQDQHSLVVLVVVQSRSLQAEALSDELVVTLHQALLADNTLGGLALDMRLIGAGARRDEADQQITEIAHQYQIDFRTLTGDITQ